MQSARRFKSSFLSRDKKRKTKTKNTTNKIEC